MYKQFKDLIDIRFPVHKIPNLHDRNPAWYRQDGILFLDGRVLDDTNMPGKTLGLRRLQCGRSDLFPLRKMYVDFKDMLASGHSMFIDSAGIPFKYIKSTRAPLIHHRVKAITGRDTCSIVWLDKIHYALKIPRPPLIDPIWARVLYYKGAPWEIYDFVTFRGEDSYRKV